MKQHLLRLSCLLLVPLTGFGQGALNPPSGPAPTMRTLDQVEPRTPIDETRTPGDANHQHIISAPGSYYLTGNLAVGRPNGIRVTVEGVTVDLNGFEVSRGSGTGGIGVQATANRFTLKNGSISGFAIGVSSNGSGGEFRDVKVANCSSDGLRAGQNSRLEGCSVTNIDGTGIAAGDGSTLINCGASSGTGNADAAIRAGDGTTLINCAALNNAANAGILAGNGATLTNCSARGNTSNQAHSAGISTGLYANVTGCTATSNTNTNGTPTGLTGQGISVAEGSLVKDCAASFNKGDGIYVENASTVVGNICSANGLQTGVGAGIRAGANNARIQNNNVTDNDVGIRVEGTGNLIEGNHVRKHPGPGIQVTTANGKNVIIRNVAGDNVNSYSGIASGNQVGPIDSNFTATSPFANFQN